MNEEGVYSDYCMTIDGNYVEFCVVLNFINQNDFYSYLFFIYFRAEEVYNWDSTIQNEYSNEASYDDPNNVSTAAFEEESGTINWETYQDEEGTSYWYNPSDGTSTYEVRKKRYQLLIIEK